MPGEGEGEWAEFFGRPAYTMTLAAKLAEREGVRCLSRLRRVACRAAAATRISVRRAAAGAARASAPTRRLNRALEELVRECPGQYLWGYNRYKMPRGAEPLA